MSVFLNNGDTFVWTVRVCNTGPGIGTNVRASVVIPPGVFIVSHDVTQGFFNETTKEWVIGTAVINTGCPTLKITVKVVDDTLAPFTASATVNGDQMDPVTLDNLDSNTIGNVCGEILDCFTMTGVNGIKLSGDGSPGNPYVQEFDPTTINVPTRASNCAVIKASCLDVPYSIQITGNNVELLNSAGTIISQDVMSASIIVSADPGNYISGGTDGGAYLGTGDVPIVSTDANNILTLGTDSLAFLDNSSVTNTGNADQVLTGPRIIDGAGNTLTFNNVADIIINGKLTVTGMIDPSGLQLVPQASNPGAAYAIDDETIWINQANGHLYRGSVDLEVSASDTYVTSGLFTQDLTSASLTLVDNNAVSPDVVVDLTGLRSSFSNQGGGVWQHHNGSFIDATVDLNVATQDSITGGGHNGQNVKLVGDVATPGLEKYYGTDDNGTRGFYALPSAPKYRMDFTTGDWVDAGPQKYITVPAATHGVGVDPFIQVYQRPNAGAPWYLVDVHDTFVQANGDVTFTVLDGDQFIGKVILV